MPPFSRLRTCVLAAAFSLTAAGALTAAPQQHAPDAHMSVSLYQGKALSFNEQIGAVFVAQPSIASYQVVGNRKVVVFGSYPGKTSLMVLGTDGRTLYNGLVEVAYDVSSMEMALKSSFPKLKLQLVALNDGVAVRGKVETAQEAANVVAFLDAMLQVNPQQAQMAAADVSAAGQEGQQEQSRGHGRKSHAAQKSGVDTFDEEAGDRGHDHDHGGPCGHQQSRGYFVVAEFVLQVEGQGHHGEHLPQKRADRR